MATVTKPIALDESFNTTELTPRNIADVLAQELSRITGRNASQVEYDNTDSGLTADNVQDALDEIAESVPTLPTTDIQTAVDEFSTYNGGLLSECKVALSPNQDLHGYDSPWVGGAGKNKLTTENITTNKFLDSTGNEVVANGYSITDYLPVTESMQYCVSGTSNVNGTYLGFYDASKNLISTMQESGETFAFSTPVDTKYVRITLRNVASKNPQLEAGSTATAYEPYENICPISGHTQVDVGDDGKNLFDPTDIISGKRLTNITGTAYNSTQDVIAESNSFVSSLIKVTQGNVVTKNSPNEDAYHRWHIYDGNGICVRYISDNVITINSGESYVALCGLNDEINTTQIRQGYQVTVNLGGTYYSGTLDVVSGVFVPDTAEVDLGTLSWTYHDSSQVFYSADITDESRILAITCDCEGFKPVTNKTAIAQMTEDGTVAFYSGDAYHRTYVKCSLYTDAPTFTTAVSGIKLVYELANPTPIQLSPTMVKALVGENHLSAPLEGQEITESKYRELFTWDEVESYVNAHSGSGSGMNYSTEEQVIGTWIDSKPLYQKTIDCGALPNNTAKNITTPSNLKYLVNAYGFAYSPADITYQRLVPFSSGGTNDIRVDLESGNVRIVTYSNWSSYNAFLTIQYTKTTD